MKKHFPLFLVLLMVSALALKSIRYTNATPPEHDQTIAHEVSNFMIHHGWKITRRSANQKSSLLQSLTYRKKKCPRPVKIIILTDNSELLTFVHTALGSNLAIFENHQFSDKQIVGNHPWTPSANPAFSYFRNSGRSPLPPLAISPAPLETNDPCVTPAQKYWVSWARAH